MTTRLPRPRDDVAALPRLAPMLEGPTRIQLGLNEWPEPVTLDQLIGADDLPRIALNRYVTVPRPLRDAIARRWGADPREVFVGNGSMDVLQVACLAYGGPGRTALLFSPTYPLYARFAILASTAVADEAIGVPSALDERRVREAIARHRPSLVVFASPNNPTGNLLDPRAILAAADAAPDALVVVDEAYAEFAGTTMLPERAAHPNLAFVKTLSKVYGAAGLRVGALIAAPEIVEVFLVAANAWTVDAITATVALRILEQPDELRKARVALLRGERERVAAALRRVEGVEVFPSDASFLLFRARHDAARIAAALAELGIQVRDVSRWGAANCVRVTIGTPAENDAFLGAVARILDAVPAG